MRPVVLALSLALGLCSAHLHAQNPGNGEPTIDQSRGIDQRVDYRSLTRFGPWDDRNYMLTLEDVRLLPEDDYYIHNVPAFWKVEYRKRTPEMAGWNMYPKSIDQEFELRYGGLMQNGRIIPQGLGKMHFNLPREYTFRDATRAAPVLSNIVLDAGSNRNECTVEYNPADQSRVIAGCNGSGQEQYYSSDGGATWTVSGNLPSTCCDPALEWSLDGSRAFAATLGNSGGLRATVFRSTDGGQTWGNRIDVSTGSSDKEWIHVDRAPLSPHRGNIYLTWHQGNVMYFSRSTNNGDSWETPQSFPSALRGIGSDITTGVDGTVYYFYPSLNGSPNQSIVMLRSTNGGASFVNPAGTSIATMRGRFEAAVPSMETRRTFFYVSTDVDYSNGPRRGRIYVSWTDLALRSPANNPAGSTSSNNVRIRVIYSDDGGTTWTETPAPHEIESTATDSCSGSPPCVDRYHQWIDVDDNGVLHIGYYDTRNDLPNRNRVDFYYTFSTDGGATWDLPPTRVSTQTSNNITNGQEWGDYNGLSVSLVRNKILTTWTDNRPVQGQKGMAGEIVNITSYDVVPPNDPINVCNGSTAGPIPITVKQGGTEVVAMTMSTPSPPAAFGTATFTPNPVNPTIAGVITNLTVPIQPTAPAGPVNLPVRGEVGSIQVDRQVPFVVFVGSPGPVTLTAPANTATNVPIDVTFTWNAATNSTGYVFELSRFSDFSTLTLSTPVTGTSFQPRPRLRPGTQYYWRVRSNNPCGGGSFASRSFQTAPSDGSVIFTDGFLE